MKVKYKIVVAPTFYQLSQGVNEFLEEDWGLQGGIAIHHDGTLCQALYIYDYSDEDS